MVAPQPWTESQDMIIFRKIVSTTLSNRSSFYTEPLLGAWAGHGGDKINKKIQLILKKAGSNIPGAGEVVNEELAKVSKGRKDKTVDETKAKMGSEKKGEGIKKRKIKDVKSEEEQELEDEE